MSTDQKTQTAGGIMMLKPEEIVQGKNHRGLDRGPEMDELVLDVKTQGVINPLSVRPTSDPSTFELIAGFRRFNAAVEAGLAEVPARLFVCTDEEADRIRTAENIHRRELNPIEEAHAINTVFLKTQDIKTTAAVVNKSVEYVTRALALLQLPEKAYKAIEGKWIPAAYGHAIMRVAEKYREGLAEFVTTKSYNGYPTLTELLRHIAAKVERDLKKAIFPKDVEYAGEMACGGCPYNTANQGALFDGAEGGSCTNPGCFGKKERQFYKDFETKQGAKLEKMTALGVTSGPKYDGTLKGHKVLSEAALSEKSIKKAMAEKPEAFGWAVQKADRYGNAKPKVVFTVVDPSVLPKEAVAAEPAREPYDYERDRFIDAMVRVALLREAAKKFNPEKPKKTHLEDMVLRALATEQDARVIFMGYYTQEQILKMKLDDDNISDKTVEKAVRSMSAPELMMLLFLSSFPERGADHHIKALGVDTKKLIPAVVQAGKDEWKQAKLDEAEEAKKKLDKSVKEKK